MYSVLDLENESKPTIIVYEDLSEAISYLCQLGIYSNRGNFNIISNINKDIKLLAKKDLWYKVHNLKEYGIPDNKIINMCVVRYDNFECEIIGILFESNKKLLKKLQHYYNIEYVKYVNFKCVQCNKNLKLWDIHENYRWKGCVDNSTIYQIKVNDKNHFSFKLYGGFLGEYKADFSLPENWNHNDYLCWCCFEEIENKCTHLWTRPSDY